jgi:hypothetical protein
MQKCQAELETLSQILMEQREQRDALAAELSDLQRQRDEIAQGLSEALKRI